MNNKVLLAFLMATLSAMITAPFATPASATVIDAPQKPVAEIATMCTFNTIVASTPETATYDDTEPGANDAQVKQGFVAYQASSFQGAYDVWLPLAIAGNATAQYYLGTLFVGEDADDQAMQCAIQWYQSSAAQEHVSANADLGRLLGSGDHGYIDLPQAQTVLLFAAERCHLDAQFQLGSLYGRIPAPHRDFVEAHKWLMVASTRGLEDAKDTNKILRRFTSVAELREGNRRHKEWLKNNPCN